jgi:hypothetical protein
VAGSRALSTLKQYQGSWSEFCAFCVERGYVAVPALPVTVAMFLTVVAKRAQSYAVVKSASAAIFTHHELAGVAVSPTKHVWCKAVRSAAKREIGLAVKNRKEPLTLEVLVCLVSLLTGPCGALHELMLATYIMVCFAGFLRYDDAQRLLVKDVKLYEDRAELFLCQRKNDQFRQGSVVVLAAGVSDACPVRLLRRFLAEAKWAPELPLFRDYNGHQARSTRRLGPVDFKLEAVAYAKMRTLVLRYVGKVLGLPAADVQERFGLHSLRSGGATAVAAVGVEERLFQAHGGWRSREAMLPYLKESLPNRLAVSAALGY